MSSRVYVGVRRPDAGRDVSPSPVLMPSFTNLPIADQIDAAQHAITNGAAADLQELLAPAGYTVSYTHLTLPTICSV